MAGNFLKALGQGLRIAGASTSDANYAMFNRQNEFAATQDEQRKQLMLGLVTKAWENDAIDQPTGMKILESVGLTNVPFTGVNADTRLKKAELGELERVNKLKADLRPKIAEIYSNPDIPARSKLLGIAQLYAHAELTKESAAILNVAKELPGSSEDRKNWSSPRKLLADWREIKDIYGADSEITKGAWQAWQNAVNTSAQEKMALLREVNVPENIVKKVGAGVLEIKADPITGDLFVVDKTSGTKVWTETVGTQPADRPAPLTYSEIETPQDRPTAATVPGAAEAFGATGQGQAIWNWITDWVAGDIADPELEGAIQKLSVAKETTIQALTGLELGDDRATTIKWESIAKGLPDPASIKGGPGKALAKIRAFLDQALITRRNLERTLKEGRIRPTDSADYQKALNTIDTVINQWATIASNIEAGKASTDSNEMRNDEEDYLRQLQELRTNNMDAE